MIAVRDRDRRREFLASTSGRDEVTACVTAWIQLAERWGVAQSTSLPVRIPLAWQLTPRWTGEAQPPPARGRRGRPVGPYDGSIVGHLAMGGTDALALRLLLTITAVAALAEQANVADQIPTIPLLADRRASSPNPSWAELTMLGPPRPTAKRDSRPRSPAQLRASARLRIMNSARALERHSLVRLHRNRAGTVTGLEPTPLPDSVPVKRAARCSDVYMPLSYWRSGWNAVLWADEIVLLLMYMAAPPRPLYARIATINGVTIDYDHTPHNGPERTVIGQIRILSASRRIQQFGVPEARHRHMDRLQALGLVQMRTPPVMPLAVRKAINARVNANVDPVPTDITRALGADDPFAALFSTGTLVDEKAPSAVASYQINVEHFGMSALQTAVNAFLYP